MRFFKLIACSFLIFICSCNVSSKSKNTVSENTVSKNTVSENRLPENTGVQFIEENWNTALEKAKSQNKLVFLDIYATWCGPCKMLKQYTFSDTSVGNFFNRNFVNVSVDGEKGIGPQLAQQFSIEGYPSLIITDAEGKPVLLTAGYMPASDLLKFANEALRRSRDAKM